VLFRFAPPKALNGFRVTTLLLALLHEMFQAVV
jgi:hypothetical protein